MIFTLSTQAVALLRKIKLDQPVTSEEWKSITDPHTRTYLLAEQAIVQERYTDIFEDLTQECPPHIAEMIFAYRDLFLHPRTALSRVQRLISEFAPFFDESWQVRFQFWQIDALHLIGEIQEGQKVLLFALKDLQIAGTFRTEALSVTALAEYLAGKTDSAAHYHQLAKTELEQHPDSFLTIFNASMALRVFLKLCDPIHFEQFSVVLDHALAHKADRRYLLRQTGYRAMLMTILGDPDEARRLWTRGDQIAQETSLPLERAQYGILRGLALAHLQSADEAASTFEEVHHQLRSAGQPGPYLAELEFARAFAPWLAQRNKSSLRQLVSELEKGREAIRKSPTKSTAGLHDHYRQANEAFSHLLDGNPATPPSGPSLVVSLVTQLGRAEEMARSLSDFRLLPRFLRELQKLPSTRENIALALQESIQHPVRLNESELEIDNPLQSHESRPDITQARELAKTLLQHHAAVSNAERIRTTAELSAQLAHDIRSPLGALQVAKSLLPNDHSDEAELIHLAVTRIQEIADDLLETYRQKKSPDSPVDESAWSLATTLDQSIREKRAEYSDRPGISIALQHSLKPAHLLAANRSHFRRTLSNLLNNAVEAAGNSGTVTCECRTLAYNLIEIAVSDTGPGFTPEQIQQMDVQNSPLETTKEKGFGLGLKHAREFIEKSGGELVIENRSDRTGARVRLILPLA